MTIGLHSKIENSSKNESYYKLNDCIVRTCVVFSGRSRSRDAMLSYLYRGLVSNCFLCEEGGKRRGRKEGKECEKEWERKNVRKGDDRRGTGEVEEEKRLRIINRRGVI